MSVGVSDRAFIDDVAMQANIMLEELRRNVLMDSGLTPLQSATQFLSERLGDAPKTADQLRIVLATFLAVHWYRFTTPDAPHDPNLPYARTLWDLEYDP